MTLEWLIGTGLNVPVQKVPPAFEAAFKENFDDIQVWRYSALETRRNDRLGFANHRDVFIHRGVGPLSSGLGAFILAHELAHVVQKRHALRHPSPRLAPRSVYEAEANAAACAVVSERPLPRLSPDPSLTGRPFDFQGHYWTVYLVAILAGVPPKKAVELATYAQLPDQITELDAMGVLAWTAGKERLDGPLDYAALILIQRKAGMPIPEVLRKRLGLYPGLPAIAGSSRYVRAAFDATFESFERSLCKCYGQAAGMSMADILDYVETIQVGLHCLNGGAAQKETEFRFERLIKLDPVGRPQLYGAALHSFADSFAHRNMADITKMYRWPLGHGVDVWRAGGAHACDNISKRRTLFLRYANGLYKVFRYKFSSVDPIIPEEKNLDYDNKFLNDIMSIPCSTENERTQVAIFKALIRRSLGSPGGDLPMTSVEQTESIKKLDQIAQRFRNTIDFDDDPDGVAVSYLLYQGKAQLSAKDFGDIIDIAAHWKVAKKIVERFSREGSTDTI